MMRLPSVLLILSTLASPTMARNRNDPTRSNATPMTGQSYFLDAVALSYSSGEEKNSARQLAGDDGLLLTKRTFPECREQNLSPEECSSLIQNQIDDAGGHEVGDINVKIQTPRTPEQFADSYWMVEVPVTIHNNVACDRNNGKTFYPLKWTVHNPYNEGYEDRYLPLDVEDIDCYGLTAGECCMKIRRYGRQLGYQYDGEGVDINWNCLSCFVHQEPLEPIVNKETGETDYIDCTEFGKRGCIKEQLTGDEVEALDLETAGRIEKAISSLEYFMFERRYCWQFDYTLEHLYNAAALIPPLSIEIGKIACMICYNDYWDLELNRREVKVQLDKIMTILLENSPPKKSSKENSIIIYTNNDREIVLDPTLGGSRSDGKQDPLPTSAPTPDPTRSPVVVEHLCQTDADCEETEFCHQDSYYGNNCYENGCITDQSLICTGENELCIPDFNGYPWNHMCTVNNCEEDPSLCAENEVCKRDINNWDDRRIEFKCEAYKELGEDCGFNEYYGGPYLGTCKPGTFCEDVNRCMVPRYDRFKFKYSYKCIAYGEGTCYFDGTPITCNKSNGYCETTSESQCRPRRKFGECCSPSLNNCELFGDEGEPLICGTERVHDDYDGREYTQVVSRCRRACDTDDDCNANYEWCAPVHKASQASDTGRFCKAYQTSENHCHIVLPEMLPEQTLHEEERCDPSQFYCHNPNFCYAEAGYNFYYQYTACKFQGNPCSSDADCTDIEIEWCDTNVGYCKERMKHEECCVTFNDETLNDCEAPFTCKDARTIEGYPDDDWTPTSPSLYHEGASICA